MIKCKACREWYPAYYITAGVCEDCRLAAMPLYEMSHLECSPSGLGIQQLRCYGVRLRRKFLWVPINRPKKRPPSLADAERLHL